MEGDVILLTGVVARDIGRDGFWGAIFQPLSGLFFLPHDLIIAGKCDNFYHIMLPSAAGMANRQSWRLYIVFLDQKNHHILRYGGMKSGGGEGGRTPVRKPENPSISERSL